MSKTYCIITGTSRGIGEALAKILLDEGFTVFGISRGQSVILPTYKNYAHMIFDLNQIDQIDDLISDIFERIDLGEADRICLINNAAMLEPLKPIECCTADEIIKNLHISLVAPILLTSCFIKQTEKFNIRKKIINITSGSAVHPAPDMSIYCTAKAGMNMFTRCIGYEQTNREYPVEILAVDPGMVETGMQRTARGLDAAEFSMAGFFRQAYSTGQLQSTEDLAKHIKRIIAKEFEPGSVIHYLDD